MFLIESITEDLNKMAITKNLTIDQGTTFVANLTAISDTNQIIDLTTYGLYGKIQKTFQSQRSANAILL